jgi:hypothetical protein
MNHTMHIGDEWKVLEGIDPISTKKNQPWNKFFFLQTRLKIHD